MGSLVLEAELLTLTETGLDQLAKPEGLSDDRGICFGNYPLTVGTTMMYRGRQMVQRLTSRGVPYGSWEVVRMPRISDNDLGSTVYLYRSRIDAEQGKNGGGTGFIVGIRSKALQDTHYAYIVTNRHVIEAGACTVRLTTADGGTEILDLMQSNWIFHPGGSDLAVYFFGGSGKEFRVKLISAETFLTDQTISDLNIGIGDDAYMIGRFINHEGRQRNTPTVRFGNIAMMPTEPILYRGYEEKDYIVEVRSISGYSGSPVLVYIPPFSVGRPPNPSGTRIWLLGINRGYLNNAEYVRDRYGIELTGPVEGMHVNSNTGMAVVIPVWILNEFLNSPEIAMPREENERKMAERNRISGVVLTAATEKDTGFTITDFENALKKVSRRQGLAQADEASSEADPETKGT